MYLGAQRLLENKGNRQLTAAAEDLWIEANTAPHDHLPTDSGIMKLQAKKH